MSGREDKFIPLKEGVPAFCVETETMTTKKVISFYSKKIVPHRNGAHSAQIG